MFQFLEYRLVPEPNDSVSKVFEKFGSSVIVLNLFVANRAIDFDDQTAVCAAEVNDVRAERVLSSELEAVEARSA